MYKSIHNKGIKCYTGLFNFTEKIPSDMLANLHNVTQISQKLRNRKIFAWKIIFYERADVYHP